MAKKLSLILTVVFCMAFFCSCSAEENTSEYDIPTGTYRYVHEDGKVSEIILTKDTVKYVNVDFDVCREMGVLNKYIIASNEAAAEGRELTEAEKQAIRDEMSAYDFSIHENKELAFTISDDTGFSFNIAALDKNGEKINGLEVTFYLEEKQLGFDEYYTLVEE